MVVAGPWHSCSDPWLAVLIRPRRSSIDHRGAARFERAALLPVMLPIHWGTDASYRWAITCHHRARPRSEDRGRARN